MKPTSKQAPRANTSTELKKLLEDARNQLFLLRLDKAQNKLKNTSLIFLKRKEIAFILTLIREKDLSVEKAGLAEKSL